MGPLGLFAGIWVLIIGLVCWNGTIWLIESVSYGSSVVRLYLVLELEDIGAVLAKFRGPECCRSLGIWVLVELSVSFMYVSLDFRWANLVAALLELELEAKGSRGGGGRSSYTDLALSAAFPDSHCICRSAIGRPVVTCNFLASENTASVSSSAS